MRYKNFPSWLKGGIIGGIFAIISILTLIFFSKTIPIIVELVPSSIFEFFDDVQCKFIRGWIGASFWACMWITPLLVLVEFSILGSIIGWIVGEIKSRGNNQK